MPRDPWPATTVLLAGVADWVEDVSGIGPITFEDAEEDEVRQLDRPPRAQERRQPAA